MQKFSIVKYGGLALCVFLLCAELASSAPFYSSDYENADMAENMRGPLFQTRNRSDDLRDLYELLLKKEILEGSLDQAHQISRKSNRSPSLRLRFGKKRDPFMMNTPLMERPSHALDNVN